MDAGDGNFVCSQGDMATTAGSVRHKKRQEEEAKCKHCDGTGRERTQTGRFEISTPCVFCAETGVTPAPGVKG